VIKLDIKLHIEGVEFRCDVNKGGSCVAFVCVKSGKVVSCK